MSSADAPHTAGVPMPRATTAAWLTRPPRDVRMPSAAIMPWRSSGDVSGRTRITRSPASWRSSASSAVKYTWPTAAPGDALRPLASAVVRRLGVELRVQQLVELRRLRPQHRLALVDQPSSVHLDGHAQRRGRGALADTRLEDEETTLLDRELDVAHVAVVRLELIHHLEQLRVTLGEALGHRVERLGGADAGHDVLALRVGEEVAVGPVLAGGRVAGERDAGAGVVALVAERHRLHVDRGAEIVGDVLHPAVDAGAVAVPRAEHGVDRVTRAARSGPAGTRSPLCSRTMPLNVSTRPRRSSALSSGSVSTPRASRSCSRARARSRRRGRRARSCRTSARSGGTSRTRSARCRSAWPDPATDVSLRPRLRTVSIIPGIENGAPERTETSSGSSTSPSCLPIFASSALERRGDLVHQAVGHRVAARPCTPCTPRW